ncbi:MAG: hypothetical protein HC769_01140 [Cyanobacteria bacterium CRU_2_1]|nr:hypothetical protein [Cyanobacteria bacterium CRU_2_1]
MIHEIAIDLSPDEIIFPGYCTYTDADGITHFAKAAHSHFIPIYLTNSMPFHLFSIPVSAIALSMTLPIAIAVVPTPLAAQDITQPDVTQLDIAQLDIAQLDIAQTAGQAIASVDPSRPIQIEIINAGGTTITCRLTQPASTDRDIPPGGSITFGTTTTSFLPVPIYLVAYPETPDIGLSMDVIASDNVVTIVIGEALSDIPGQTTVSIETNGAVYTY